MINKLYIKKVRLGFQSSQNSKLLKEITIMGVLVLSDRMKSGLSNTLRLNICFATLHIYNCGQVIIQRLFFFKDYITVES